jgi:primosomal protein N' (replication factor Y)
VLGSATPSLESYYRAMCGSYRLLELNERVDDKPLPDCEVVDLREEMHLGNRSILSFRLQELMEDRLEKNEQIMLFLNRRGVLGFISCRSCGNVLKCPHCDVSLSQHEGGRMLCHYCGYEEPMPQVCPACGSRYLGGFKAGTQKIESMVARQFPDARILRMDYDTTRTKDSYEKILQSFANHEADILIGTQMIVKGHDFPNVTLVGVLAADMSLHVSDYHAAERTFQLLTQAVGRAGRGKKPGQAVIQTYDPGHYAIRTAQAQDYEAFYEQEIAYRSLMSYPPVWNLLVVHVTGPDEQAVGRATQLLADRLRAQIDRMERVPRTENAPQMVHSPQTQSAPQPGLHRARRASDSRSRVFLVGPADATIARINDIYRKVVYMKADDYRLLIALKDSLESFIRENPMFSEVAVQYDFNPASGF